MLSLGVPCSINSEVLIDALSVIEAEGCLPIAVSRQAKVATNRTSLRDSASNATRVPIYIGKAQRQAMECYFVRRFST